MSSLKFPETEAILATGSLLMFAGAMIAVFFHAVPGDNEKYVMLLLGALIGIVKDTFARYFSSTKGAAEQRKDLMGLVQSQNTTDGASK